MPKLSDTAIQEALTARPGWQVEDGMLVRRFKCTDFVAALGFIAQVGALQERANHHATITNTYGDVQLALSTHDVGGISEKDFGLAGEIDERAHAMGL